MPSDLISVIIPLYNCEDRIIRCVNSVLNQTYENIEVIVIDDGSTDRSLEILKNSVSDPRLKVFHHDNHGVSYTRNRGIEIALNSSTDDNGWITFVDSDDYIHPDTFKDALNHPEYKVLDLVQYGGRSVDESGIEIRNFCNGEDLIIDQCAAFRNVMDGQISEQRTNGNWFISVTRGLFRKKILKTAHLLFDESLNLGEDAIFSIQYIALCKKMRKLSVPYYTWWKRSGGSLSTFDESVTSFLAARQATFCMKVFPMMYEIIQNFDHKLDKTYASWIISQFNFIAKLSALECLGYQDIRNWYRLFSSKEWLVDFISSQELDSFQERCTRLMIRANKPFIGYTFVKILESLKFIGKL